MENLGYVSFTDESFLTKLLVVNLEFSKEFLNY
jgi:hypothetical protein